MSISSPSAVPPGWYPDPSGQRQWRVWNGTTWTDLVRPYGQHVARAPLAHSIGLIQALHRLVRYGIVAVFAGTGLVVSALAHWPGTHQPAPLWFAETATDVGIGLLLIGSVAFALALRELQGRWTAWALVPGVNVLATGALVFRRLGRQSPAMRVVTNAVLLALYVANAHRQWWLGAALVVVALDQMRWTLGLVDQLAGPTTVPAASGP